jgi:hypothetical protein
MLAEDFWKCGSDAQWVEAIVSIAGVINGSTLTYLAGCDPATGKLTRAPSFFIQKGLEILKTIGTEPVIDLYLDQWTQGKSLTDDALFKNIDESNFAKGDDNLAFDLSLQGCYKANKNFGTQDGTYYLTIVTSKRTRRAILWHSRSTLCCYLPRFIKAPAILSATRLQRLYPIGAQAISRSTNGVKTMAPSGRSRSAFLSPRALTQWAGRGFSPATSRRSKEANGSTKMLKISSSTGSIISM